MAANTVFALILFFSIHTNQAWIPGNVLHMPLFLVALIWLCVYCISLYSYWRLCIFYWWLFYMCTPCICL